MVCEMVETMRIEPLGRSESSSSRLSMLTGTDGHAFASDGDSRFHHRRRPLVV